MCSYFKLVKCCLVWSNTAFSLGSVAIFWVLFNIFLIIKNMENYALANGFPDFNLHPEVTIVAILSCYFLNSWTQFFLDSMIPHHGFILYSQNLLSLVPSCHNQLNSNVTTSGTPSWWPFLKYHLPTSDLLHSVPPHCFVLRTSYYRKLSCTCLYLSTFIY